MTTRERGRLHGWATELALRALRGYFDSIIKLVEIEAAKGYLKAVQVARLAFSGLVGAALCVGLLIVGFLMLHVALLLLLPISPTAITVIGLGSLISTFSPLSPPMKILTLAASGSKSGQTARPSRALSSP